MKFAGICRLVWNLALDQRLNYWRQYHRSTGSSINWATQSNEITALRKEVDFVRDAPRVCLERTILNLEDAFKRLRKRIGGVPKFKAKGKNDSFSFQGRDVRITKINRRWAKVWVPKIGWVKFRITRDVRGVIKGATFTKTVLGWQVSFDSLIDDDVCDNGLAVGIDRGVAAPIALSDGRVFTMPESIAAIEIRCRAAQRTVSRRKKGSNRRVRAIRVAARMKARQARIRKHWAHQATTVISREFGTVVIERLRTKNMTASAAGTKEAPGTKVAQKRGLNRAILNVGWHQIETMLTYKAARLIKVNAAYSSQTCASCGTVDSQSRKSQAIFDCTACGHTDNADRNAAIVILNRGSTPGVEPCHWAGDEAQTRHAA